MTWTVVLDPSEVAQNRTELDINNQAAGIGVDQAGIDWGDAAIQAYMSDQQVGSSVVDYRIPNRNVVIPLTVGVDDTGAFYTAKEQLLQKIALLQREGGWLKRGDTGLYADIVNATLTFPDKFGETGGIEPGVSLNLECLPDFYGDEITLDSVSVTGLCASVLESGGSQAVIEGDHPGRCRVIVTDTSGNIQQGLIWGLRSRHYDSDSTAALRYEAEAMTPLNGAASAALAGASNGTAVIEASLPAQVWIPILSTRLAGPAEDLTHTGSYRVWVRCYSVTAAPLLRLAWAVGSIANPVINDPVMLPGQDGFYLLDLGVVRLDQPPVGTYSWTGIIQAYARNTGDPISIDEIIFQPLDEGAGTLAASLEPPPTLVASGAAASSYVDDSSSGGTEAWTIASPNFVGLALRSLSHYLKATGYGFSIPTGATIQGIQVNIDRQAAGDVVDQVVKLVQGGAVVGSNRAVFSPPWVAGGAESVGVYGGPNDLWGTTWTPAQINAADFGAVLAVSLSNTDGLPNPHANVLPIAITVYWTIGAGFSSAPDAVIDATQTSELRTDGMFRTDAAAPISIVIGDLPRIPPSGLEGRAVQLLVKPSQGDLDSETDAGLDGFTAQVKYRPSWIFPP